MLSSTVTAFGQPLQVLDVEAPTPSGREVVIDVSCCGVCHTDLHLQDGYYDIGGGKRSHLADRGITPPLVLGHEVLGRLVAAGPDADVSPEQVGRTFLVYPWIGCGTCGECLRGDEPLCAAPSAIGVARPGGYAEQCVVPDAKYLIEVDGLDPALAATYACSGLTAYSALNKVDIDPAEGRLLIIGLGGVGLSGLLLARAMGFQRIVVAEVDAAKRGHASSLGIEVVDPTDPDSVAGLAGTVSGVVDFVGNGATARLAVDALRKGGTAVLVGLFGGEIALALPPLVQRSLTVRGSFVGSLDELKELVSLARSGRLEPIPTQTVPFDQADDALRNLRSGNVSGRLVLARVEEN